MAKVDEAEMNAETIQVVVTRLNEKVTNLKVDIARLFKESSNFMTSGLMTFAKGFEKVKM